MPRFKYKARNQAGQEVRGWAETASLELLKSGLRERGLWVTQVQIENRFWQTVFIATQDRVKTAELVMFSKQAGVMLEAGVSLLAALDALQESASPNLKTVIAKIAEDIKEGKTLASALGQFPHIFSPFYIGMIEVGEAGGILAEMLTKIASHLEQGLDLRKKLLTASIYPAFVFVTTIIGIIFILTFAFPKIADVYSKNKVPLPLLSQLMLSFSGFLQHQWYIPLTFVFLISVLFIGGWHTKPPLKSWLDRLILKLPFYGDFYRQVTIARFSHNLALLLNSGLPILKALDIIKTLLTNEVVKEYLNQLMTAVMEGEGMTTYLRRNRFFPPLLISMTRTGEESGELAKMMNEASRFYESEVENGVKKFVAVVEPALILVAAGMVFLVLLAFYLPMFKMFKVMGPK